MLSPEAAASVTIALRITIPSLAPLSLVPATAPAPVAGTRDASSRSYCEIVAIVAWTSELPFMEMERPRLSDEAKCNGSNLEARARPSARAITIAATRAAMRASRGAVAFAFMSASSFASSAAAP